MCESAPLSIIFLGIMFQYKQWADYITDGDEQVLFLMYSSSLYH